MTGSHDASGQTGAGALVVNGAGTVSLAGANSYTGGTKIKDGTLLLAAPGAAGSGTIAFVPLADPVLEFSAANAPTNPIAGFGPGDFLQIDGETIAGDAYAPGSGGGVLTLDFSGGSLDLAFTGSYSKASFLLSGGEVGGVACYAAGTRIATARGEVAVEHLRVGERVITALGGMPEIIWIGHCRIDCRRHPEPGKSLGRSASPPAHSAAGCPHRALLLSPDHAVLVGGVLIPIRCLINGTTIAQVPMDAVTYWHLELPRHDVLLAEGLPAESYLDTGNRGAFANGGGLHAPAGSVRGPLWTSQI